MNTRHSHYRPPARIRAFSLAEVLVVVTLLCIVAAIAIPAAGGLRDAKLSAAERLVLGDLDYARVRAFTSTADRCVIVLEAGGGGYHLATAADPGTPIVDRATGRPYVRRFGVESLGDLGGVEVESSDIGADQVLGFTGLGGLDQAGDANFLIHYGMETSGIRVNATTGQASTP